MNPDVERLRKLEEEAQQLKQRVETAQAHCRHEWSEPVYDPETVTEPYGTKFVAQGSDHWSEPEGYHQVQKPRWRKDCAKCGKSVYAKSRKQKTVDDGPAFEE
jgi:hypothetical protein